MDKEIQDLLNQILIKLNTTTTALAEIKTDVQKNALNIEVMEQNIRNVVDVYARGVPGSP